MELSEELHDVVLPGPPSVLEEGVGQAHLQKHARAGLPAQSPSCFHVLEGDGPILHDVTSGRGVCLLPRDGSLAQRGDGYIAHASDGVQKQIPRGRLGICWLVSADENVWNAADMSPAGELREGRQTRHLGGHLRCIYNLQAS